MSTLLRKEFGYDCSSARHAAYFPGATADKGGYYEIADSAPQPRDGGFSLPWP